ncbi:hypothetical protein B0A55_01512 [Friedmanniomyces simplex]|uniref:Cytochrome b5 heme-binding domain-containing protein n=1 Tax=Friedmanniomyces simplex TaxID=329884 RepID=A0A4U0Y022_9PEZI|nr:hypothetical protein B0A55_01512 [Friedmanniomyces simplex]
MADPARDIEEGTHATAFKPSDMNASTAPPAAQVASIATPINLILLSLFLVLAYMRLRPSKSTATTLPSPPPPTVYRVFTPLQLLPFNGTNSQPVYLAVRGQIFDVSPGRNFYGPGGPYANFAGRDASRGLACGSFDEEMLTEDLKGPLDRLEDLGGEEMDALRGWEERFQEKYLVVGKLVPVGHEEAEEDEKKA